MENEECFNLCYLVESIGRNMRISPLEMKPDHNIDRQIKCTFLALKNNRMLWLLHFVNSGRDIRANRDFFNSEEKNQVLIRTLKHGYSST